jgi:hypothetical protein
VAVGGVAVAVAGGADGTQGPFLASVVAQCAVLAGEAVISVGTSEDIFFNMSSTLTRGDIWPLGANFDP